MNLVILIASALIAVSAAVHGGSSPGPTVSTSAGVTAAPTPSPSPAPPTRNDVISGGGGPT